MNSGPAGRPEPLPAPSPRSAAELDGVRYDVAVVGAGIGGLVAAALLARHGRRVLVVERHAVAGGNATVFRRPGYVFDVGLHYVGGCHADGVLPRILRAAGAETPFVELDADGYDVLVFPDEQLAVPRGIDRFRDRLCERFGAERAGIDRYVAFLRWMQCALHAWPDRGRFAAALLGAPRTTLAARGTFGALLDRCTRDPRLRAVLGAWHIGYALPPSRASALVGAGIALHYLEGAYYPAGGGQVPADRLVAAIEAAGGRVLLGTSVTALDVRRGAVRAIALEGPHTGARVLAVPTVVVNSDLKRALTELVPEGALRRASRRRAAGYVMAPPLGVLYLGVRDGGEPSLHRRANYWIAPVDDVETHYRTVAAGRIDPAPAAFVTLAGAKDPGGSYAPPGVANAQLMTVAPASPAAWGATDEPVGSRRFAYRRRAGYAARRDELAEALLRTGALLWPDLAQRVVFREVATPLTHVRYTASSGGTAYGIAATPEQFLERRPGARTEIAGLVLCGASCRAGHGIVGAAVSGLLAAAAVLPGRLERAVLGGRRPPP